MENKNIGVVLMAAALAGVVTAVGFAATSHPPAFSSTWYQDSIGAACVVFLAGLVLVVWAVVASWQRKPRLEFGAPYRKEQTVGTVVGPFGSAIGASGVGGFSPLSAGSVPAGAGTTNTIKTTFVYVPIYNAKRPERRAAEGVVAKIHYHASTTMEVPIDGRWADPPESQLKLPTQRADEKTILANGNAEPLDVAMKYTDDDCCYAFNNDNRSAAPLDLRHRPLPDKTTPIETELSSTTAQPLKGRFELHHDGAGSQPNLEYKGTFVRRTLKHPWAGEYREKLYAP